MVIPRYFGPKIAIFYLNLYDNKQETSFLGLATVGFTQFIFLINLSFFFFTNSARSSMNIELYDSGEVLGDKCSNLLGEILVIYKIETIKTLNIYISAFQAIVRSYMELQMA